MKKVDKILGVVTAVLLVIVACLIVITPIICLLGQLKITPHL